MAHLILLGIVEDFFGFWFRKVDKEKDPLPHLVIPNEVAGRMDTRIKCMKVTREFTRKPNALR